MFAEYTNVDAAISFNTLRLIRKFDFSLLCTSHAVDDNVQKLYHLLSKRAIRFHVLTLVNALSNRN